MLIVLIVLYWKFGFLFMYSMILYSFVVFTGDGEVIEQIISLQTNDTGERSPESGVLGGMVRQLQQQGQSLGADHGAAPGGPPGAEETPRRGEIWEGSCVLIWLELKSKWSHRQV